MTTSVYWIHHPDHTDMFSQGYIGVSKDAEKRWEQHLKKSDNRHFRFAINKYGWGNLIKKQILIAEEDYCLDIERKLRPTEGIGWNVAIGGGKPPVRYGNKDRLGIPSWNKGLPWSKKAREKLSEAHLGQVAWNKGLKGVQVAWNKGKPMHRSAVDAATAKVSCIKCRKTGSLAGISRWHFDGCIGQRNFRARVTIDGKRVVIGVFSTKEEANQARLKYIQGVSN
jgi:GIY-YIG catalytic domain